MDSRGRSKETAAVVWKASRFAIEKKFDFVLTPDPLPTNKNKELTEDEMGLSFYSGEDIDLSPYTSVSRRCSPCPSGRCAVKAVAACAPVAVPS